MPTKSKIKWGKKLPKKLKTSTRGKTMKTMRKLADRKPKGLIAELAQKGLLDKKRNKKAPRLTKKALDQAWGELTKLAKQTEVILKPYEFRLNLTEKGTNFDVNGDAMTIIINLAAVFRTEQRIAMFVAAALDYSATIQMYGVQLFQELPELAQQNVSKKIAQALDTIRRMNEAADKAQSDIDVDHLPIE